jgi:hypothetical protein
VVVELDNLVEHLMLDQLQAVMEMILLLDRVQQ